MTQGSHLHRWATVGMEAPLEQLAQIEILLLHLSPVGYWAYYLTSLSLHFLICKLKVKAIPASWNCLRIKWESPCRGTSLVVQYLGVCLSMQGTWVQSLVREDPTCHKATKPMCHNYWSPNTLESMLCNDRSHHSEKPLNRNWRAGPFSATRENPCAAAKTQHSKKKKKEKKKL